MSAGTVLSASCVGDRVPARASGRVHSVFARACNVELQSGELVTLLKRERDAAPHGICLASQVADFPEWLGVGQHAHIDDAALCLPAAGRRIDFSEAPIWRGAVAPVATPYNAALARALHLLRRTLDASAPEQGIAPALASSTVAGASALDRAFAMRLRNVLPLLDRATERGDATAASDSIAHLIGLGPGLTPSGDDFLCGYLAALWSRASFDEAVRGLLTALAPSLSPLLARTHVISRQMLRDAMQGRFARSLCEVTEAIAGKGDLLATARHLLSSGHSSGADALCGLLFGYDPALLLRSERPVRAGARPRFIASCAAALT